MPSLLSWLSKRRRRYSKHKDLDWPSPCPYSQSALKTLPTLPTPTLPNLPNLPTLPTKVLVDIASHLTSTDRAALALVSQTILRKLGTATLALKANARFRLLRRLERDGVCKMNILCLACRIFHVPRLHMLPIYYAQPLRQSSVHPCISILSSPYLPAEFSYNVMAAVMRNHRHGWTSYPTDILSSSYRLYNQSAAVYVEHDTKAQFSSYTTCKIVKWAPAYKNRDIDGAV